MERNITKINVKSTLPNKKKVAAYCRVSVTKDATLHSLAAQVSYYQDYISSNPKWVFVGIYADEGISGTKVNRPEFNRMIEDCKLGKIDMILTKSISRFARNTMYLLETTRLLKSLNIDVYFEEQNMHSLSNDGELMLSLLASFAEEEVKSMSNNIRWKVNKFFEEGKVWGMHDFFGYKVLDDNYIINEEEAKTVRLIFYLYIEKKMGYQKIANYLNKKKIPSPSGLKWCFSTVRGIAENVTYTGELILGRYSAEINCSNHSKTNKGQFPMYYVTESHPAIISKETYQKAQEIKAKNNKKYVAVKTFASPFDGIIKCGFCGRNYVRKRNKYRVFWICSGMSNQSGSGCKQYLSLREDTLYELTSRALEIPQEQLTKEVLNENLEKIIVHSNKDVDFLFKNGDVKTLHFEFKSRKYSWTPEMKEQARRKELERLYGKSSN